MCPTFQVKVEMMCALKALASAQNFKINASDRKPLFYFVNN